MATVFSYIRFSSRKQGRGDSLRRQLKDTNDWIERNGHTLADLTLHDLGIPSFRGENRHKGALSEFLKLIEEGKVEKGSILLVENLDRLSREGMLPALSLFNEIVSAGVIIAVLQPHERLYTKQSLKEIGGLLEPLISFHLANEESQKKSDRLGKAWKQKRENARTDGIPFNARRPAWLDYDAQDKKFTVRPNAKKAIKYIFQRTIDGCGQKAVNNGQKT